MSVNSEPPPVFQVAALLDSDRAGEAAARQDALVHTLGNNSILRTKDAYSGPVAEPEIEDLLRDTLISCAKEELGWDIAAIASARPKQPIVDIFEEQIGDFSKYKLAKSYVRWTRSNDAAALTEDEREQWTKLISAINKSLK